MPAPAISIVLPAYNCGRFVAKTIDSLLAQTFTDFELVVLNDGSTDETRTILHQYNDSRMVLVNNERNLGLIATLNKGIGIARGHYIARMDADDIALPQRLQLQKDWLDAHPQTAVVASTVTFINEHDEAAGVWPEDRANCTAAAIRRTMPWENCIAHPTVMLRTAIARQYLYKPNQRHCEDYDLWLRLLADGHVIEKLAEPLVLYRVHTASITGSILKRSNPFTRQFGCKRRFLAGRLRAGKWGTFEARMLATTLHNGMFAIAKNIKQTITG